MEVKTTDEQEVQYVYIGQYYHIKNKELPLDYKFGVTNDLNQREYSLSRTKSPIKYMILGAWEITHNINREKIEKLISTIFDEEKYDGCEWYDIDGSIFLDKIDTIFNTLSEMFGNILFNKVDLENRLENQESTTKLIEKEIRERKRSINTTLIIDIEGNDLSESRGKDGYINTILYISNKVSIERLHIDFPNIVKSNNLDFPEYKQCQSHEHNGFYIDSHSSTSKKKDIIISMLNKYNIIGSVNIVEQ